MSRPPFCFRLLFLLIAFALCGRASGQEPPATQVIELNPGWNLISIQVGGPITPVAFKASLDLPSTLIEIWGYAPTGDPTVPGHWNTYQPTLAGFPSDLVTLDPGKGYWVNVGQFCKATLSGITWDGSIVLGQGWNLVGFPGLSSASSQGQPLASVFGTNFSRIPQVYGYDSSSAQRFVGYDITAIPMVKDLTYIVPGRGYWVYSLDAVTISPGPLIYLPADSDASPLQAQELFSSQDPRWHGTNPADYVNKLVRFRGTEDIAFDLNGNGILDDPLTQDTLKFDVGVDAQIISVANGGGGIINYALANTVPWLFTAAADAKAYPSNSGRPKTASGVVSSQTDNISLYVDRTGLTPGPYSATFTLYAGTVVRTITVKMDVPTSAGDWKGLATTQRVNGKNIPIGAVDMGLNVFMASSSASETSFTAVLNQDTSLLFPRDVFMNGVFYSGSNFSLTTNFQMDAGDRNAPPYDTFSHVAPNTSGGATLNSTTARQDKDYNGNGLVDVQNPFPFAIHRQVTLLGVRTNPNHMEGSYIESITGMLPGNQPIFIEGTFFLDRQSLTPTKKSIFNGTTTNVPITIGSTSGTLYRETTLNVSSPVTVSGVTVNLNISFPDSSKLLVYLVGPNNQIVNLSRYASSLGTTYTLTDFNGISGAGTWKLHVEWLSTSLRGTFTNWSLNVQGLATYSVAAKVKGDLGSGNQPLAGVHAILSGSNVLQQADTDATGLFTFSGLTENQYTVTLTKPGFTSRSIAFYLNNAAYYLGDGAGQGTASTDVNTLTNDPIILPAVPAGSPQVIAAPFIGAEPLNVNFSLIIPNSQLTALGSNLTATWNFGDGTPSVTDTADLNDDITLSTARHIYLTAGDYTASLTLSGSGGTLPLASNAIHVQRVTPDTRGGAPVCQVIGVGFIGSFAAPLNNGNVIEQDPSGPIVYQESKRDSATFDIDRSDAVPLPAPGTNPTSTFNYTKEDTDYGDPNKLMIVSGDGSVSFPFLARPYLTLTPSEQLVFSGDLSPYSFATYAAPQNAPPDRFRIFCTMGGFVFGEQPSLVGDYLLQAGRIEP